MLYEKVLKTIEQKNLIQRGFTVIVAVSGGADSVCLLDILSNLSSRLDFKLEAAHINHNLRGKESDGDEEYVISLCEKYKVKLHRTSIDVLSLANGKSLEEVARQARYDFFETLCKNDHTLIATAHTVNDNTETFFINLLRGSGSRGLCSIPIKRQNIIRPMLDATREEIINHLSEKGLSYRTDSTNSDTDYLRNFIRHEVLPVFNKRQDINIHKAISHATDNLLSENKALEKYAIENDTDDISKLCEFDDAILYRILTKKLENKFNIILDNVHFSLIKQLLHKACGKIQVRADIYAVCKKGKFNFERLHTKATDVYPLIKGQNDIENRTVLIKNVKEVYKGLTKILVDCDKINGNLFLRTKRDGDSFTCIGRKGCTTKLSKLLKNDGIDEQIRNKLWVICDQNDKIVFVEKYGVNADVMATKESKNILSIEII